MLEAFLFQKGVFILPEWCLSFHIQVNGYIFSISNSIWTWISNNCGPHALKLVNFFFVLLFLIPTNFFSLSEFPQSIWIQHVHLAKTILGMSIDHFPLCKNNTWKDCLIYKNEKVSCALKNSSSDEFLAEVRINGIAVSCEKRPGSISSFQTAQIP